MLTTTAMDVNNPAIPDMENAFVGILKYRQYDSMLVSHNGGVYVEAESADFDSSIQELVNKV